MALRIRIAFVALAFALLGTSSASPILLKPMHASVLRPSLIPDTTSALYVSNRSFIRHLHSRLPLYRKWFQEAAMQSSQDWRLLAAIGYQESKWNPNAASSMGAIGLMQLTERSASEAKVSDPSNARESIFGGARYFRRMYKTIPMHVPEPDRTWFALAAYNIGYGHLEDARVLTQRAGRNPDSWADVRKFLPLLTQEYWYAQTENGYARGSEPVHYVDKVRNYQELLLQAWGDSGVSLERLTLTPGLEKSPQQRTALLAADAAENIDPMRQSQLAGQIQ